MNEGKTISRRLVLQNALTAAGVLPVLLVSMEGAYAKVPKQSVSYRETPNGADRCSVCANFIEPASCKLVEGPINPEGWCGLFKPKG